MRDFKGKGRIVIGIMLAAFTLFQLYTEAAAPLPPLVQNSVHLLFALSLVLLMYPAVQGLKQRRYLVFDIIICLAVVAFALRHIISGFEMMPAAQVARPSVRDLILAVLFIIVILETTRRTIGMPLVIVTLVFTVYAFAGPLIPGPLGHEGITPAYFVASNYLTELGSMGTMVTLSSGMIFAVVAFGAFMLALGGGELLIRLAVAVAGQFRGGPAKVGIIGSALFGMITGSAVANIGVIGVYTIPMMKRIGYRPEFAGAVESCASTGSMIMPPVMGVAAFIMAQFLGISYNRLIVYAIIPAIFYFLTLFIQVHLEAVKNDLKSLPREEIAAARRIPKLDLILLVPVAIFVYLLVGPQFDVAGAAFRSSVSVWVCFIIRELAVRRKLDFKRLALSFEAPARQMLALACSLACMGLVIYAIDVTGLATKLSTLLVQLSGNNLWLLMILTMIASLILGMGLPATPCYIFLAILAAPALVHFGVMPLAAHMFIFYFGIISAITPPVCLASYVAAAIAQADSMKVAVLGTKLSISGYVVPFMFVIAPTLLLQGGSALEIARDCLSLLVASLSLAITVVGHFRYQVSLPWRIAAGIATVLLVYPGTYNRIVGYALLALVIGYQIVASRRVKAAQAPTQ